MNTSLTRRVLVVEDDKKIAQLLMDYLRNEGFEPKTVGDGHIALREIQTATPSAVILDLELPGLDGISICKAARNSTDVPILMLTARAEELDRIAGLDCGADDYMGKPFAPREVVARVRALIRRAEGRLVPGSSPWKVDEPNFRIAWRDQWLSLTRIEFLMLRMLLTRPGRVFTRAQIMDCVNIDGSEVNDRTIDSHIKNIRRKIEKVDPGFKCIATVYGVGYRFDVLE